ncbi:MAG: SoxR reducing system RseC family protein [Rhodocyclaceae bacterium]
MKPTLEPHATPVGVDVPPELSFGKRDHHVTLAAVAPAAEKAAGVCATAGHTPMVTRDGRVIAIEGGHARVRFERESACGACRAAKVCAGNAPTSDLDVALPAGHHLSAGDSVRVGVAEASALRATLIAYVVPLLGLVTGMALASLTGQREPVVVLASLAGLAAGVAGMRRLARHPLNRIAPVLLDSGSDNPNSHPDSKENHA